MYPSEKVYRSVTYFTTQIVPSGVSVLDGQSYGIMIDDTTDRTPSVAVTSPEIREVGLELGSSGAAYDMVFTVAALSRSQRDAIKDILASGFNTRQIPIYSNFSEFIPASGATVETYAEIGDYFRMRDIPDLSSDRERFIWVSVVFITLNVL